MAKRDGSTDAAEPELAHRDVGIGGNDESSWRGRGREHRGHLTCARRTAGGEPARTVLDPVRRPGGRPLCHRWRWRTAHSADGRDEKRWMQQQNAKKAKADKKKEIKRVAGLVEQAERRDPRLIAERERVEKEKEDGGTSTKEAQEEDEADGTASSSRGGGTAGAGDTASGIGGMISIALSLETGSSIHWSHWQQLGAALWAAKIYSH